MKRTIIPILALSFFAVSCGDHTHDEDSVTEEVTTEEVVEETQEEPEAVVLENIEMVVDLVYANTNVLVQNPYSSTGMGWCMKGVKLNGADMTVNVETDTIQIDLSAAGIAEGDSLTITLIHEQSQQ